MNPPSSNLLSLDGPQMRHTRHPATDDEIGLFDLWDILVGRRWLVVGVWALVVLAAVAYLLIAQPVFESRAVLRVGRVGGEFVTPPAALVLELRERFEVGETGRERPFLQSVKQEGDDAVEMVAEAHSAEEAQRFLLQNLQELLDQLEQRYNAVRKLQEAALATVDAQIAALEEQIQKLGETATELDVDDAVRALIVLQRSTIQADLPTLQEQRLRLQQSLTSLRTYPAQLVREPTLPEQASSPRKALTLALALVLGAMLGVMAAFLAEFLEQARKRRAAS